jgi:hypothetical protein
MERATMTATKAGPRAGRARTSGAPPKNRSDQAARCARRSRRAASAPLAGHRARVAARTRSVRAPGAASRSRSAPSRSTGNAARRREEIRRCCSRRRVLRELQRELEELHGQIAELTGSSRSANACSRRSVESWWRDGRDGPRQRLSQAASPPPEICCRAPSLRAQRLRRGSSRTPRRSLSAPSRVAAHTRAMSKSPVGRRPG